MTWRRRVAMFAVVGGLSGVVASACATTLPTSPGASNQSGDYSGQWQATLVQPSGSISFVVSSDQKVTSLSIAYNANGCSVSVTNSTPLPIFTSPAAPSGFQWATGSGDNVLYLSGAFVKTDTFFGFLVLGNYANCGNGTIYLTATRR